MKNKTVFSLVTLVALLGALNIQGADRGITGRPSIGTQQEMDAASAAVAAVSARKNDVIAQLQAQLAAAQAQIAEFQRTQSLDNGDFADIGGDSSFDFDGAGAPAPVAASVVPAQAVRNTAMTANTAVVQQLVPAVAVAPVVAPVIAPVAVAPVVAPVVLTAAQVEQQIRKFVPALIRQGVIGNSTRFRSAKANLDAALQQVDLLDTPTKFTLKYFVATEIAGVQKPVVEVVQTNEVLNLDMEDGEIVTAINPAGRGQSISEYKMARERLFNELKQALIETYYALNSIF